MSTPPAHDTPAHDRPAPHITHASVGTYIKVAVILTLITGMEFSAIYIRQLSPILIPLLLVLSTAKFALVVLFFMHLRYDPRALSVVFVGSLIVAAIVGIALMTLYGNFLVYGS